MKHRFYLVILLSLLLAGGTADAQDETQDSEFTNKQLREKSVYRQKTTLGVFTIGSHGLIKDEREQSKTGDLELGRVFEFKHNQFIPRIVELETFVINRLGSYEDSLYESLGIGAGSQLSYRKEGNYDKWFLRFTAIEPSEYYEERYGIGAERTVFELTLGRSYAIAPVLGTQRLKQRLASYALVASVPETAIGNTAWSNVNAVHFLNGYLAAHYFQLKQSDVFEYDDLNAFDFIIQRSGVILSEQESRLMELRRDERTIPDRWQPAYQTLFKRALTILLRDKCRIIFKVTNAQHLQAFSVIPVGEIRQDTAIDLDRMIETYLHASWPGFKTPAN